MYGKIVAGYDGRPSSEDALALAKTLADVTGAHLTAVAVMLEDPFWGGPDPKLRDLESDIREELSGKVHAADAELAVRPSSSSARGLCHVVDDIGADLIVVGSGTAAPVGQVFAGNVALCLLHGAPCAVAVAPKGYAEAAHAGIDEVTVGYDGAPESHAAVADGIEFARRAGAKLTIVAVVEPPPISHGKGANQGRRELTEEIEAMMHARLDELVGELPDDIEVKRVLTSGHPAQALAEAADSENAILFVGSRSYGPMRRALLGSVSRELVRSAPCAVIVHPRSAAAGAVRERAARELTAT